MVSKLKIRSKKLGVKFEQLIIWLTKMVENGTDFYVCLFIHKEIGTLIPVKQQLDGWSLFVF